MLFKDSAQAANRYIYNHSVNCHSMSAVTDDNSILGSSTMVTIPRAAQIEAIHLYTLRNISIHHHVFTRRGRRKLDVRLKEITHAEKGTQKNMKISVFTYLGKYNSCFRVPCWEAWVWEMLHGAMFCLLLFLTPAVWLS